MAGPATVLEQPFHVRSISLPSRPQPSTALTVEEELQKLRTCVASASSATPEMMSTMLRDIANLYNCVEEILRLPSNQQAFSRTHQRKLVENELDQSIRLLDQSNVMRDNLVILKEHAQELSLSLRRKDAVSECNFARSGKKAQKEINNIFRSLKQRDNKFKSACDVSEVIGMLMDAREITISLLQAIVSSLNKTKEVKDSKWSFVSQAFHQRKVACEDNHDYTKEAENLVHLETGLDFLLRRTLSAFRSRVGHSPNTIPSLASEFSKDCLNGF